MSKKNARIFIGILVMIISIRHANEVPKFILRVYLKTLLVESRSYVRQCYRLIKTDSNNNNNEQNAQKNYQQH